MSIRKTNQELKSAEMKQYITDVAKRLFSEYGFKKVSVRDIAEQANVTTGTLYYYFKNKDDILEAAYENDVVKFERKLQEKLEEDTEEPLLYYFFCELMVEHLMSDGLEFTKYHYFERRKFWDKDSNYYQNIIKAVKKSGEKLSFRDDLTIEEIVDYLLLVFRGTATAWARLGDEYDLKKKMRWNMNLAVKGLTK